MSSSIRHRFAVDAGLDRMCRNHVIVVVAVMFVVILKEVVHAVRHRIKLNRQHIQCAHQDLRVRFS